MTQAREKVVTVPRLATDQQLVQAVLGLHARLELPGLLQEVLRITGQWTGCPLGFAFGSVPDKRGLQPLGGWAPAGDAPEEVFGRLDIERLERVLPDGWARFEGLGPFAAVAHDWKGKPPAASLAFAVRSADDRWGGLILLAGGPVDNDAIDRCRELITHTRPAVSNALQVLSMRELVIKDDTASCFNRRHFEESLPEELSRAARFRSALSLIFLDMDNLKEVNSLHGHAMGSRTLHEVSMRVKGKIRKFDKLFRFGGDEFCIVLPETNWHGAVEVAERVREAINSHPMLDSEIRGGVQMTASLGVASYPVHARTRQDLIQLADRAMQRIKKSTKNGVGVAETTGDDEDGD